MSALHCILFITFGLLMHGKPPNFATLIRWVRAA